MENYRVKDLMVPLSEYATVPEDSTLLDAMLALEKSQKAFDRAKYTHRSILVLDHNRKVIGKLSFIDAIAAFGPKNNLLNDLRELNQFGFSPKLMRHAYAQRHKEEYKLQILCKKASEYMIKDFMQTPTAGEYIEQDAPIQAAIHQFVVGNHPALLVTDKDNIIGILRLTDVFAAVFHTMKACENSP